MTASKADPPSLPADLEAPPFFRLLNEIGIIAQLSGAAFEKAMPEGMTLAQFTMLNHLYRLGGPKSPAEMARNFQVTKGAVTHTMGKLSARGLIRIAPAPNDGRSKDVYLTEAGAVMRERCIAVLAPGLAELDVIFGEGEAQDLANRLETLRRHLDAARD